MGHDDDGQLGAVSLMGGRRDSCVGQRGQGLVEFALVIPIFFLAVLALAEGAAFALTFTAIEHATQEGGRLAALPATASEDDVRDRILARAGPALATVDPADITITVSGCASPPCTFADRDSGDRVRVVVTYEYRPLTSAIFGSGAVFDLSAATEYRVE